MAPNITERVIKLIALENQLISVVEDQGFPHLEFLNPQYALPFLHYIYSTFELQRAIERRKSHMKVYTLFQQNKNTY